MLSIKIKSSPGLDNFMQRYPQLYEDAKTKGTNKSLDLLQLNTLQEDPKAP